MTPFPKPTQLEQMATPALLGVDESSKAIWTVLLINSTRRGFSRLVAYADLTEPDWVGWATEVTRTTSFPVQELLCPNAHPGVALLCTLAPINDGIVEMEYNRAFHGEFAAHQHAYETGLVNSRVPGHILETIRARSQHEELLRSFELLITQFQNATASEPVANVATLRRLIG